MDELYSIGARAILLTDIHACRPLRAPRPRCRTPGARWACATPWSGSGSMLFVVCAAAWFGFDDSVRARFNVLQRLTLLVMGAGFVAVRLGARPRARDRRDGRRWWWSTASAPATWPGSRCSASTCPTARPWATLDLADGTTISAMAFQGSDGRSRARRRTPGARADRPRDPRPLAASPRCTGVDAPRRRQLVAGRARRRQGHQVGAGVERVGRGRHRLDGDARVAVRRTAA